MTTKNDENHTNEPLALMNDESTSPPTTTTTTTTTTSMNITIRTQNDNDRLLDEWKSFLQQTDRIDLLLAATEAVTQLHPNLLQQCIQHDFIPLLVKHVAYDDRTTTKDDPSSSSSLEQVSVNALRALVYLSSHGMGSTNQCVYDLITIGKGMNRMMEIVLSNPPPVSPPVSHSSHTTINHNNHNSNHDRWATRVNYAMALMANMTRTELGAIEFMGHTFPEEPIYHPPNTTTTTTTTDTTTSLSSSNPIKVKPTLELLLHRYLNPKYVHDEDVNYQALLTRDNEANDDDDDDSDDPKHLTPSTAIVPHMEHSSLSNSVAEMNDPRQHHQNANTRTTTTLDSLHHDPYQHFAAILLNITSQSALGRQFVLQIHRTTTHPTMSGSGSSNNNSDKSATTNNDNGSNHTTSDSNETTTWTVLQLLLGQLKSRNPLRRRGIAGMVRNICQNERDSSWWLLNVVQLNIHLLYPLAGPEELDYDDKQGLHVDLWMEGPDKLREPDHITRLFLVEAILFLLSTGRASRNTMRLQRTYVILKIADLVEEMEDVSAVICDCVNYLRRDEHGTAEGSSDALIEDTYQLKSNISSLHVTDQATASTTLPNDDANDDTKDENDFDHVD